MGLHDEVRQASMSITSPCRLDARPARTPPHAPGAAAAALLPLPLLLRLLLSLLCSLYPLLPLTPATASLRVSTYLAVLLLRRYQTRSQTN